MDRLLGTWRPDCDIIFPRSNTLLCMIDWTAELTENKTRDQKQIYRLNETKSPWGLNLPAPPWMDTLNSNLPWKAKISALETLY